jgi:uncharacterized peroxidase-related enzyme
LNLPEYERIVRAARPPRSSSPANLPVIEEDHASGEVAELYAYFRSHFGRPDVPGILKCFATHPPLLRHMMDLSESLIFSDGYLARCYKEMIATFVSVQNDCPYCADSHGFFFRIHGGSPEALCAIQESYLQSDALSGPEQALLAFAQKVNRSSSEISRADIDQLLRAGWGEPQIAEAIHVVALFSTFNRVANAFGLESQCLLALAQQEPAASQ